MTLFARIDKLLGSNHIKAALDEFQKFLANCPGGNDDLQGDVDKVSTALIILSSKFADLSEKQNSNTIAPDVADRERASIINSLVQIKNQMRFNHPDLFKHMVEKDEENAWQEALHNNTIDGYQDYFSKYPNGKYKEDSIKFIKQLREKRESQDNEIRKIAEQEKVRRESIETGQGRPVSTEYSYPSGPTPAPSKSKKTLFIVSGIVVVAAVAIFFIINSNSSSSEYTEEETSELTSSETQEVKTEEAYPNKPIEPLTIQESFSINDVKVVQYNVADGSKSGSFKINEDKTWTESNPDGTFTWHEAMRDEWSIYLTDKSRNYNGRLDFHLKAFYLDEKKSYILTAFE